jgi:hypothetical protein
VPVAACGCVLRCVCGYGDPLFRWFRQVRLQRQQKEAAARHRELMDMKTREIAALKKHTVTQQKTVTSLQVCIGDFDGVGCAYAAPVCTHLPCRGHAWVA